MTLAFSAARLAAAAAAVFSPRASMSFVKVSVSSAIRTPLLGAVGSFMSGVGASARRSPPGSG